MTIDGDDYREAWQRCLRTGARRLSRHSDPWNNRLARMAERQRDPWPRAWSRVLSGAAAATATAGDWSRKFANMARMETRRANVCGDPRS